ncbi:TetR/AcrR family transcriptional regulator [Actinocrispum wychmicini]|uniref:TetR family transcriptional regulator n=1 Tax=Actinocrispum wychmicini TaxID=1213861 RepID=A0A4R2JGA3_9PSEU|nr:TetR/AcrR family transcriptional regulator [Actinocrispum wychmicini]TCO58044.1 TetR family transcriptional regulator [Actinocrispum wychmicini]
MGNDVRTKMIRSAAVLFRERGVAGTSLADVVEHSGAPRGSIYHHFPGGKDQLAQEATRWAAGLMTRLIDRADDPVALVRGLAGFWRAELGGDFRTSCPVMAAALAEAESASAYAAAGAAFTEWETAVASILVRQGVPSSRAMATASLMIAAVEGAIVVARAQRSVQALDRVEAELVRLVSHLLVDTA